MIRLLDLPHCDARALLAKGLPVYVLVNPVEYHGPHLSLHNDLLISRALVPLLHARLGPLTGGLDPVVVDDAETGMDPTAGPGTRRFPLAHVRHTLRELARALAEFGAQRVVFMTFHGAPLHATALEDGVTTLEGLGVRAVNPFNALLQEMVEFSEPERFAGAYSHLPPQVAQEMMPHLNLDFHAGFFETSLALHLAPGAVSPTYVNLPPCPALTPDPVLLRASQVARRLGRTRLAGELRFAAEGAAWQQLRPFPGYTGHPARATAEAGAVFTKAIVDVYGPLVRDVLESGARSPQPIMQWLNQLTLGGRLLPQVPVTA